MRHVLALLVIGLVLSAGHPQSQVQASTNPCVNVNLHPVPSSLPNATAGVGYTQPFWVTPNNPCIPILWTVTPSLPPNLSLTATGPNSALLQGIPQTPGFYTFTVTAQATYVCGTVCFPSRTYTLTVL